MRATLWIAVSALLLGSATAHASDDTARRGYHDVSYGEIPQATFGAPAATPADAVAAGHDDVSYGAASHASFALDLPVVDEAVALRYDDELGPDDRVRVPTAVANFARQLVPEGDPPREWAERLYDVRRWTPMERGGHFAPVEEPELLARDIAAFFADVAGRREG